MFYVVDERKLKALSFNLRENLVPYFETDELIYLLEKNNEDLEKASYEGLILKSEITGLSVSGLTTKDSSSYFKMLASKYAQNNSGVLK